MTLFEHAQRLNIALTSLMASITQIDALARAGIAIETQTILTCYTRIAETLAHLAEVQEEITRLYQGQQIQGKDTQP